ncbi:putative orotidine-monophosphate-decarboxylase [Cyclospora cayetanensis]|uniref:Orotidine 5'-phosphate decarboxylase n=1 Tax=Cyclospora cayetanensis TaxID=88456 RepID=A0A1D3D919_9EIME|nr:putative orotidine-monophosphate-decarboxylase [Cyclospora cayetanensis]
MGGSFLEKLVRRIREERTLLCIGIDPPLSCVSVADLPCQELEELLDSLFDKCLKLVKATAPFACCFKPNVAFFEQYGPSGMQVLRDLCKKIPEDIPIILDAKRAAMGEQAKAYAEGFLSVYNGDCITLDPYLGIDAVLPYIEKKGKGVFVVCRSSNPRSADVQGIRVCKGATKHGAKHVEGEGREVYMEVAKMCEEARQQNEPRLSREGGVVGLVVGATYPDDMSKIRKLFPDLWFLAPGVGAQGGDLEATIRAGMRKDGLGLIINVGRAISEAEDPGKAAEELCEKIRSLIPEPSELTSPQSVPTF